jgi:hypothetical protein
MYVGMSVYESFDLTLYATQLKQKFSLKYVKGGGK